MFRVYFDETGDDIKHFLMAGWLTKFTEWERFSEAWATELKSKPSIEYFKHNEAMGRKGQFASLTETARNDKLMSLAGVIARHDLVGIVGTVAIPDLNALFSNSILPKKTLRSAVKFTEPYHHACQCVISVTLGHQVVVAKNLIDQVDFIFDEGVSFLSDCIVNYPKLISVLPPQAQAIAGTIRSGNDKHIVALQAADMLAGQELLKLKAGITPSPLSAMGEGRISHFNCLAKPLETIPKSISRMNVVWASRQLEKAEQKGKGRNENKNRREK